MNKEKRRVFVGKAKGKHGKYNHKDGASPSEV